MRLPFSLFSLSIVLATVSIILLTIELIIYGKADYVIDRKKLKSVGILLGIIYLIMFLGQILITI